MDGLLANLAWEHSLSFFGRAVKRYRSQRAVQAESVLRGRPDCGGIAKERGERRKRNDLLKILWRNEISPPAQVCVSESLFRDGSRAKCLTKVLQQILKRKQRVADEAFGPVEKDGVDPTCRKMLLGLRSI